MNAQVAYTFDPQQLSIDLRNLLALCDEALGITTREGQSLANSDGYHGFEYYQQRKTLLPRLEASLMLLRRWRQLWQDLNSSERARCPEVTSLFQVIQGLLMKILLLDRENQQALLRHGLRPPRHLPSPATQRPHCVADVYRRHLRP